MGRMFILSCFVAHLTFALGRNDNASGPALNLTRVTNDTFNELKITLSVFSLQDTLFPNSGEAKLWDYDTRETDYIFTDACRQPDGSRNCTISCSEPSKMFVNLQTIHNCMVFDTVAAHAYDKNLTATASTFVQELGIAPIRNDSTKGGRTAKGMIQTCLTDYCESIAGCREGYEDWYEDYYSYSYDDPYYSPSDHNDSYLKPTPWQNVSNYNFDAYGKYLVTAICNFYSSQVTEEIGGIGIYVSYWLQTGIALLGFVATLLWNSWIYCIYHGALSLRHGIKQAHEKAQWIRSGNQRHLSRLAMALTDFQKAQCFFMLAVNMAAQFVLRKGGLQAKSLQQLYNTYVFIKVLAISGYLPVTFTLFTLHLIGMVSWYLLALSICSVALSVSTLASIGNFDPSQANLDDLASVYVTGTKESCGYFLPGVYCYVPMAYDDSLYDDQSYEASITSSAYKMLGFCMVVLLLLICEKAEVVHWSMTQKLIRWLLNKLTPCRKVSFLLVRGMRRIYEIPAIRHLSSWIGNISLLAFGALMGALLFIQRKISDQPILSKPLSRRVASWRGSDRYLMAKKSSRRFSQRTWDTTKHVYHTANYASIFRRCIIASLYIVFSSLYIYWFGVFSKLLGWFATNQYYSTAWNFGQIVAITVWAPPLFEYIHLEFRGMRRGFDHKLLAPYRVTKDELPSPMPDPQPEDSLPLADYAKDPGKVEYGYIDTRTSHESMRRYPENAKNPTYLESGESPGTERHYSEDDDETKWQIPVTVLPAGDLSPFSSP